MILAEEVTRRHVDSVLLGGSGLGRVVVQMPSMSSTSLSVTTHFKQESKSLPAEAMWP